MRRLATALLWRTARQPNKQLSPARHALLLLVLLTPYSLSSANEIPDPLSLEQALAFAADHPRVVTAEPDNPNTAATGRTNQPLDLPRAQPLYLGCHSLAFSGARDGDARRDVAWSPLLGPEPAQRLEIMQRFFDVLLADLSFARDNEAMAVAFIQFDRAEARGELGQFSELKIAELRAQYQLIRRQRAASEAAQRVTRALLASALGHPESLPRELISPDSAAFEEAPGELDDIVARALSDNPRLRALMQGRDEAEQALLRMAVRERALELITRLELLTIVAHQTRAESDWRDLVLDERRTLYEFEAASDLGFSMSQQTKARRDEEEAAFCRRLTIAELNALQGLTP